MTVEAQRLVEVAPSGEDGGGSGCGGPATDPPGSGQIINYSTTNDSPSNPGKSSVGSRAPRAGGVTRRCSRPAAAMTCVTCARTARRGLTARASVASPTRWTPSGSRGRRWRTRCCPRRSSALARTRGLTSCTSCWRCGITSAGRPSRAASICSTRARRCSASYRWSCASSYPTRRRSARGWPRLLAATAASATTPRRRCDSSCWTATGPRSPSSTPTRRRSASSSARLCRRAARRLASCAA
jgi:hypothetical protein